jgi:hypothetical protein
LKPLNDEDLNWFIRWIFMRRKYKNAMIENGMLKSEVQHLNYMLNKKSVALRLPEPNKKVRVKKYNNNNKRK